MKIALAIFVAAQALLSQDVYGKCLPTACTKIYAPVCDSNGVTHSNECEFKNYQCSHPLVTIAYTGECKKSGPGCEVVRCTADTHCVEEPVECLIAPCPVVAKCVPNTCTKKCGPYQECAVYESEEYCKDTCAPGTCAEGEVCNLEEVQCVRAPCPPIAKCSKQTACPEIACTAVYKPVCGSDGKTYGNSCELKVAQCGNPSLTQVSEGECPKPTCGPTICPEIYQPVCGSNGQTYGNKCEFNGALCKDPSLTIAHDGECDVARVM